MQKNRRLLFILAGLALLVVTVGCALMQEKSTRYEVWAADQNDDKIYVLDPEGKTLKTIGRDEKEGTESHEHLHTYT